MCSVAIEIAVIFTPFCFNFAIIGLLICWGAGLKSEEKTQFMYEEKLERKIFK